MCAIEQNQYKYIRWGLVFSYDIYELPEKHHDLHQYFMSSFHTLSPSKTASTMFHEIWLLSKLFRVCVCVCVFFFFFFCCLRSYRRDIVKRCNYSYWFWGNFEAERYVSKHSLWTELSHCRKVTNIGQLYKQKNVKLKAIVHNHLTYILFQ